jgi:hypothetical protein
MIPPLLFPAFTLAEESVPVARVLKTLPGEG